MTSTLKPFAFDAHLATVTAEGGEVSVIERRLGDLPGCFQDRTTYVERVRLDNSLVYTVVQTSVGAQISDLLTGFCMLQPGKVGDEYYMTRGHTHLQARAEIYYCINGEGMLVTQHELRAEVVALTPGSIAYVPSGWAHRHMNTGTGVLITAFAVSGDAGHDYDFVRQNPFTVRVIDVAGRPTVLRV